MTKSAAKSIGLNQLQLGVCYYPEHWPESMWEDDFRRMRELNLSIIRVAEFAWSIFEPEEGEFRFELFDRVLDLAGKYGLKVIMGTPTATPPAWLTQRYPEVLNMSLEGVTYQHGARRHYNYSSPKYRELCARITERMAEHYRDHPAVVGWQIDNELNCEINIFYSDADHAAFREWLKVKYGSLAKLNEAWGAVFWNQTYTDWQQVHLTRPTVSNSPNPHQALDEKRFISDNAISFAKLQADILREKAPNHWVTTNGMFGHLDSHELTDRTLDFFSYDSYPQFSTIFPGNDENPLLDRAWSLNLTHTRSVSPNFCVMEQQSGPGGWVNRIEMASPRPGQMRLWTYQSIMHGTDMLLYFRWRTATVGTEIYWHGINDYHNRPNRRVRELRQISQELASLGSSIAGTKYRAEIAILRDYDNLWDGELDNWHGPLDKQSVRSWFKQLQYRHIPVDVLYLRKHTAVEDLLAYKTLIYPHAAIMTDQTAQLLTEFARRGGKIIFGARTGYKNTDGHCNMAPFPGPVADLCGITVTDFTLIKGTVQPALLKWSAAPEVSWNVEMSEMKAEGFNDILQVEDPSVEIVAAYASDYYAGAPALTRRKQGQGEAWYYGAAFSEPVVDALIGLLGLQSPLAGWVLLPPQVETGIRSSGETDYIFLLNYGANPAEIKLAQETNELLGGETLNGHVEMPPYGVLILQRKK
ncbi:beta-galactosidase [Paenibacillus abyssi]|uniref:Beta-galactosidase n=1 Tax=Paenibacillus abyssi TaxID=1340531 RepID=A0A917CZJ1_9BACL|nr:beta-galactosidase [Paenibacillus abyssi]GGG03400.1 beta-galactosidase [Paenibacillus abyssi]